MERIAATLSSFARSLTTWPPWSVGLLLRYALQLELVSVG
jgi:hypothetical protein